MEIVDAAVGVLLLDPPVRKILIVRVNFDVLRQTGIITRRTKVQSSNGRYDRQSGFDATVSTTMCAFHSTAAPDVVQSIGPTHNGRLSLLSNSVSFRAPRLLGSDTSLDERTITS